MATENTVPTLAAVTFTHTTGRVAIPADMDPITALGVADQILCVLERGLPYARFLVTGRGVSLVSTQADIDVAAGLLEELIGMTRYGTAPDITAVEQAVGLLGCLTSDGAPTEEILSARGRLIRPKAPSQKAYTNAIDCATVVFGIGLTGTGKTYLAMAQIARRLLPGEVRRIVLTHPAVKAGENFGFLPGSLTDKIDPYLHPLYDALGDMLDLKALPKLMAASTTRVAPLAYIYRRALSDSFIILDEAQNTMVDQMKMSFTRLGFGSRVVVTGDASQIDPSGSRTSGLSVVENILGDIGDTEFCHLTNADVVCRELVDAVIGAYQYFDDRSAACRARTHSYNTARREYMP